MSRTLLASLWVGGLIAAGCDGGAPAPRPSDASAEAPLRVYVVNHPLQAFAETIGGDEVEVVFPAPEDVDPAHWLPDPETVAGFQNADLILMNGAGYAGWARHASLPRAGLVDTSRAFRDRLIPLEGSVRHTHGPDGGHAHRGTAFTTWLDPTLAILQAQAVAEALAGELPGSGDAFRRRWEALRTELMEIDTQLAGIFGELGGAPVLFSHPVYEYLARRYELNARSLHWEPETLPDAAGWRELEDVLAQHPATLMIWEDEPLDATADGLTALGVRSAVFRPAGNRPPAGDVVAEMRENAARLRIAVTGGQAGAKRASP